MTVKKALRTLSDSEVLPVQIELFAPEPVVRPDHNIGKWAGVIFASPYARDLTEISEHHWQIEHREHRLDASLTVSPRVGSKRPTTTTLRVFLALLQVWQNQGRRPDGVIDFSARQLTAVIGWKWAGRDTAHRIAEHIIILSGTGITWTFAFMRANGDRERRVSDMSLISTADYIERKQMLGAEKFQVLQRVRLNGDLVDNMLAGFVRPFNYKALQAIGNDTALNLYTRLDLYLSKKPRWSMRSVRLFRDELGLVGTRYEQRFARHAKLKQLVAALDGAELLHGTLRVWVEKTSDGEDYKLCAAKLAPAATKNRSITYRCSVEEAELLAADIIDDIERQPRAGKPNRSYITFLCRVYPQEHIRRALSTAKADYRNNVRKTVTAIFVYELRCLVEASPQLHWHKKSS